MSIFNQPLVLTARSVGTAAPMGATMLASPLTSARADTVAVAAFQLAQAAAPAECGCHRCHGHQG